MMELEAEKQEMPSSHALAMKGRTYPAIDLGGDIGPTRAIES